MPVTAKLSRLFYERLGDQIADELVGWFNQVDATYRADVRELNELNFARFDAKLEQRLAETNLRIDRLASETSLRETNARIDGVAAGLRAEMARLEALLERRLGEQTRWLFLAWASQIIAIVGFGLR